MANSCNYNCVELPDHEQVQCGNNLTGGINKVALLDCDHTITDWSSQSEWQENIDAGRVKIIQKVRGSIPEPTPVEGENPNGCGAATQVDNYDRTAMFKDYNVTASNIDLYNQANRQQKQLVMYQECQVGGPIIWVIDSGAVYNAFMGVNENNREKLMFTVNAAWTEFDMPMFYDAPPVVFD